MDKKTSLIVISGPTAVGKSTLALQIAQEYDFPIISADSRQVFKELSIGTAKPSIEERKGVPHIWMDEKSISEKISAGIFVKDVKNFLKDTPAPCAIVCGGTQFYIESLLYDISEIPPISEKVKKQVENIYQKDQIKGLINAIERQDPEYLRKADKDNQRRLMRALEVILETGKPYSSFNRGTSSPQPRFPKISFFLNDHRETLYDRINSRVDHMLEKGLEMEARKMHSMRNNPNLNTVGYREFFDYFDGIHTREEAVRLIKRNTRRYAKRQLTWYRNSRFIYLQRHKTHQSSILKEIELFLLLHRIK